MKKMYFFLSLVVSQYVLASATQKFNCNDLAFAQNKLNVATLNFLNAKTTKTHRGSFYRRKLLNGCFKGKCNIIETNSHRTVYDPFHPDANANGDVKYPAINTRDEYLAINSAVKALSNLAHLNICHAKLTFKDRSLIIIHYKEKSLNHSFKLLGNKVYSWTTHYLGENKTVQFLN